MKYNILLADDDESIRFVIAKFLTRCGYKVQATDNPQTLMKWIENGDGDLVLSDVHMGSSDIFTFIPDVQKMRPQLPIIVISANTSVITALKSANSGVFDYVPKPFDLALLEQTIKRALGNKTSLPLSKKTEIGPMIGKSASMQPVFRAISDYMSADIAVNIHGEAGTGKTLVARLLHDAGKRKERPFIYFDEQNSDLSLLDTLKNGDLFVEHISDLTGQGQQNLLRLLTRNERQADKDKFRVLSTLYHVVGQERDAVNIRPDLLHSLLGGRIFVPPLRERLDDITALAGHFLQKSSQAPKKRKLSKPALSMLKTHLWPGNIRELKHSMEILALRYPDLVVGREIIAEILHEQNPSSGDALQNGTLENMSAACRDLLMRSQSEPDTTSSPYQEALGWVEKPLIEAALTITGGNNLRAAELLGIHRNTLRTKIKELGIGD